MSIATYITPQLAYLATSGIMPAFTNAANQTGMDKNLLLAIASRESNMGLNLDRSWLGDGGNGIGLMQIDRRYHPDYANSNAADNHQANVLKGAQVLRDNLNALSGNVGHAVAAYNTGVSSVKEAIQHGLDPDLFTTGQDYSRDVLNRYEIIKSLDGNKGIEYQLATYGSIFFLVFTTVAVVLIKKDK